MDTAPDSDPLRRFLSGKRRSERQACDLAVEVRSEYDFGPRMEIEIAQKRADYFTAGTLVVWDVDPFGEDVIKKYAASDPQTPQIFRRGQIADAEPAVPGWTMRVDEIFE